MNEQDRQAFVNNSKDATQVIGWLLTGAEETKTYRTIFHNDEKLRKIIELKNGFWV